MATAGDKHQSEVDDIIKSLTYEQLENVKGVFKSTNNGRGLNIEQFQNSVSEFLDAGESERLFETIIKQTGKYSITISWQDFLDFILKSFKISEEISSLNVKPGEILAIPHTKRENIVKIVIIETKKYFSYAIATKHGRIGLYDGNLNFLISYHVIMTREDIMRCEENRRRRNRWITDAIYCPDVLMFIITNSARSIIVYEASGLKHVPMWLILSTPNIIMGLAYKPLGSAYYPEKSILFAGDDKGIVMSFHFAQPKVGFLRKKQNDKLSLFYWDELKDEKDFVSVQKYTPNHKGNSINVLNYYGQNGSLVSCCEDSNCSIIQTFIDHRKKANVYKCRKGACAFALSIELRILITGSSLGSITLWNPIITNKPIRTIRGHAARVVDIQIFESQKLFFTLSFDGEFKVWDIKDEKCLQTIRIKFPAFNIFGKLIEFGTTSIYPGPTRRSESSENESDIFEKSHILVCCCNYISKLELQFSDESVQRKFETSILSPQPLQNSVLIPNTWRIQEDNNCDDINSPAETIPAEKIEERLKELDFILERDLSAELNIHTDINYKIATLERQKLEMKKNVASGAPYLALNVHNIEDLKLSETLPTPSTKKANYYATICRKLFSEAENKDVIFSEPSSSRSKSSRSSIVEFP